MSSEAVVIPTGIEMKSYGCIRSLNRQGIRTVVASDCGVVPQFASRYCSEQVHIPPHKQDAVAYKNALLELAARPEIKTIIPVREIDVYLLAKYNDEFTEHVSLVVPTFESLSVGHDRLRLAEAAEDAGVPFAETRLLSDVEQFETDVVVKSRYNILTSEYLDDGDPQTVSEVNHVRFFEAGESPDKAALRELFGHDPIVQAFIPEAKKHLYCSLWVDGEPVSTYQHEQHRKVSWVGGGGVYRESAYSRAVDSVATDLLGQLEWTGYACIEYIKDAVTGDWKFLELNPRVWHSIPEAVRAGVDFPSHYWHCAHGSRTAVDDRYETGIKCHTSYGELKHLLSIRHDETPFFEPPSFWRTLGEIAYSCLRQPRFDYIRADDPRLFVSAITHLSGIDVGSTYDDNEIDTDTTQQSHNVSR